MIKNPNKGGKPPKLRNCNLKIKPPANLALESLPTLVIFSALNLNITLNNNTEYPTMNKPHLPPTPTSLNAHMPLATEDKNININKDPT